MKILCITTDGDGMPIAYKLKNEGNDVKVHIVIKDYPQSRGTYKGIMDNVPDWKPWLGWCDYVCFFNNKLTDIWEQCIKKKPCFCGSAAGQKLEKDRTGAHKLMKSLGMKSPESLTVKTSQEVQKHLKSHRVKHVLKYTGGTTDSDDVYIGEYSDNRDLLPITDMLEESEKEWDSIEIEERIDGIEAGVAGYFDGHKFAPGIEINFQMKRFCSGNQGNGVGFLTGEMGTLVKMTDFSNPLFQRTLAKMGPYLRSINYRGEIDVGCIINDQGDWFIEHTPRKGYPDCVIRFETQVTPEGNLYYQIAKGNVVVNQYRPEWGIGIVVVAPGFPDKDAAKKRSAHLPIIGWEKNKDHCHLFEAEMAQGGPRICEGGLGYPLVVTDRGKTAEDAIKSAYSRLDPKNPDRVYIPKCSYRDDIGRRVVLSKEKILRYGILEEHDFETRNSFLELLV